MTTITAKFYVERVEHIHQPHSPDAVCANVTLKPVYGSENEPWSKYTPNGKLEMTVTNPSAIEAFDIGANYLMTFEKVDS